MKIEITDFSAPELEIYAGLREVQLLRYYEPEPGLFVAESPKVIGRALDAGYEPVSVLMEKNNCHRETTELLARLPEIPVYTAEFDLLTGLTGFELTRGMLCAMRRKKLPSLQEICRGKHRIAILEEVVNPTNVGAIFRSAAALGMEAVVLTGGCSDPLYRRAARVSMGTVFQIPWTMLGSGEWPEKAMSELKTMGYSAAAMALSENSVSISDEGLAREDKLAVILGTEGDGLAAKTIADCDYTVKIPMTAGVDSLNVAAASAVAFWQLGQNRNGGEER